LIVDDHCYSGPSLFTVASWWSWLQWAWLVRLSCP
jgi:hypothetical protein